MIKVIEAKGDTIDAAIQNALAKLGCDRDDVSVEVISKPKSGFLGFGKEPAVVKVTYETSPAGKAKDFIEGMLVRFGTPAHIEVSENREERTIHIELSGDNMGAVIGRRGDTLDAFQYLTSIVTNKGEEERWIVTVDTENYRVKREAPPTTPATNIPPSPLTARSSSLPPISRPVHRKSPRAAGPPKTEGATSMRKSARPQRPLNKGTKIKSAALAALFYCAKTPDKRAVRAISPLKEANRAMMCFLSKRGASLPSAGFFSELRRRSASIQNILPLLSFTAFIFTYRIP